MKPLIYEPLGGERIEHACHEATRLAKEHRRLCRFSFNDVTLMAAPKKSAYTLEWEWTWTLERERSAYRNSKKGQEAERQRVAEVSAMQIQSDFLIKDLPNACQGGLDKVMLWLSAFAEVADRIGVTFDTDWIIALLESAGFRENAHVGRHPSAFNNRKMMGHYIVGQAINCMRQGMPPHPMTLTFVEKYFKLPA